LGQSDAREKKKVKVTALVVTFLIAHVWSMLGGESEWVGRCFQSAKIGGCEGKTPRRDKIIGNGIRNRKRGKVIGGGIR
jgi:hypothetical protein